MVEKKSDWHKYEKGNQTTWPTNHGLYLIWRENKHWSHSNCISLAEYSAQGWGPGGNGQRGQMPGYESNIIYWHELPPTPPKLSTEGTNDANDSHK